MPNAHASCRNLLALSPNYQISFELGFFVVNWPKVRTNWPQGSDFGLKTWTRRISFASGRFGSGSFKARGRNLSCIFCLKNGLLLENKPRNGNRAEPSAHRFLAECSDKRPSAQYLRPNLQPIYHFDTIIQRSRLAALLDSTPFSCSSLTAMSWCFERKYWAEGHSVEHSAKIFLAECSTRLPLAYLISQQQSIFPWKRCKTDFHRLPRIFRSRSSTS